jgi:hypothetical protein
MAPTTVPDSRIKKRLQELLDANDPCLEVSSVKSRGSTLSHSICDRLGLDQRRHSHTVTRILLNKAKTDQIAVYRGGKRVERVDINSIKNANAVRKIVAPAETPCATPTTPPLDLGSPADRAAKAHDLKLREAYHAKLKSGGVHWQKQSVLLRDAVIWYLLQLPEHTLEGSRLKREDILGAANLQPTEQLLASVTNRIQRLAQCGIVERRVSGKSTMYLRLLVELDTQTIEELRQQFAPESVAPVTATPVEPEPVVEAPEPEPITDADPEESLEDVLRRVLPEFLGDMHNDLLEAISHYVDARFRAIGLAILSETGPTPPDQTAP